MGVGASTHTRAKMINLKPMSRLSAQEESRTKTQSDSQMSELVIKSQINSQNRSKPTLTASYKIPPSTKYVKKEPKQSITPKNNMAAQQQLYGLAGQTDSSGMRPAMKSSASMRILDRINLHSSQTQTLAREQAHNQSKLSMQNQGTTGMNDSLSGKFSQSYNVTMGDHAVQSKTMVRKNANLIAKNLNLSYQNSSSINQSNTLTTLQSARQSKTDQANATLNSQLNKNKLLMQKSITTKIIVDTQQAASGPNKSPLKQQRGQIPSKTQLSQKRLKNQKQQTILHSS